MGERVILTEYRTDVADFYKMTDIFLFPSIREGLLVAVMEAMASGLPVIAAENRGSSDLLQQGALFESEDEGTFYKLMKELINGYRVQEECTRNLKTLKRYDIRSVSMLMQDVYKAEIEGKNK